MSEIAMRIVIGLVALLIGWTIGFFDSKIRADKKIGAAEKKAEAEVRQARAEAERAARAAQAAAPAPVSQGNTLLRLWLDSKESPQLELDGQAANTSQISEPQRKRLIQLLSVMRPWIEGKPGAPASVVRPAAQTPVSQPLPSAPKPAMIPTPAPVTPPALAIKDDKPAAPLSMVAQIDEILQTKLATTTYAGRGIRLQESPEGGVTVLVGIHKYAGVGEVPDAEIQAIIRLAIAEWEKKYTPR